MVLCAAVVLCATSYRATVVAVAVPNSCQVLLLRRCSCPPDDVLKNCGTPESLTQKSDANGVISTSKHALCRHRLLSVACSTSTASLARFAWVGSNSSQACVARAGKID